jgi:hypothetical protein
LYPMASNNCSMLALTSTSMKGRATAAISDPKREGPKY